MKEECKNMKEFIASLGLTDSDIRLITEGTIEDAKTARELVKYYMKEESK